MANEFTLEEAMAPTPVAAAPAKLPTREEWQDINPGKDYDAAMRVRKQMPTMEAREPDFAQQEFTLEEALTPAKSTVAPTGGGFFDKLGTGMNIVRDWATGVPVQTTDKSVLEGRQIPQLADTEANRRAKAEADRLVAIGAAKEAKAKAARDKLRTGAEKEDYGVVDFFKDSGLDAVQGTAKLGESYVGLLDLTSGGAAGRVLAKAGYSPKGIDKFLTGFQSITRQNADANVEETKGFLDTLGAMAVNPTALVGTVVQSLPSTVASGLAGGRYVRFLVNKATGEAASLGLVGASAENFIARKVKDQATKIAAVASGAEGVQTAGLTAEAGRQAGKDWNEYVLPALAAGFGTTAIGVASGKVGQKFGIGDIETSIAARSAGVKGIGVGEGPFLTKFLKEVGKEGFLEELPQSAQEQIFQNLATGRPWDEGIGKAAAQGLVAGLAMAGGHSAGVAALQKGSETLQKALTPTAPENLAETMARERGFLTPEGRAPAVAPTAPAPEIVPPAPEMGLGEMGAVTPGEVATTAPAERRAKIKELALSIEDSGISPEDALAIAEQRVAREEAAIARQQEAAAGQVPTTPTPTNRAEEITQELIAAGFPPNEAAQRAQIFAEQEAEYDARAEAGAGEADIGAGAAGVGVAEQPVGTEGAAELPGAEQRGVVPTGPTAEGAPVGEGKQPRALAGAPITLTESKTTRGDPLTGASTKVKLSDGSEHEINRQDTNSTAGLPGWHDVNQHMMYSYLGNTKAEAIQELIRRQERKAESQTQEGAPSGIETPETVQAEAQGQEAVAAPTVGEQAKAAIAEAKKPRGRPKLALTPEQSAAAAQERKDKNKAQTNANNAVERLAKEFETLVTNKATKQATIRKLLGHQAVTGVRSALGKRITEMLKHPSVTAEDIATAKHANALAQPQTLSSVESAASQTVADPKFAKLTNGVQAITHIIKTGDTFQKHVGKLLRGFVNGVQFVVLEKDSPIPARLQSGRASDEWAKARAMYVRDNTGAKIIYVRGASFGKSQGVNNVTVLHELLHAATSQKLRLGLLALKQGFSPDNSVTRATVALQRVMENAKEHFDNLTATGELPEAIQRLKDHGSVFTDINEFLAYGMSDKAMQEFLLGARGERDNVPFMTRFVTAIRDFFGMGENDTNALTDLIVGSEELINAQKSPTMKFIERQEKKTALGTKVTPTILKSAQKTEIQGTETRVRPSANVARLAKMLGSKLYGTPEDIAKVSIKELFQNSFDAIKESLEKHGLVKGKIDIKVDSATRSISIVDNGPGMPNSVMGNQFLQIAGTVKGTTRASGGLGVAKMLFLFENKELEVISLRDGVLSRMVTTGDDLKAALDEPERGPVITTSTDPKTIAEYKKSLFPDGHGTSITVRIPETYRDESSGEDKKIPFSEYDLEVADVLNHSPLFDNIEVTFDRGRGPRTLKMGSAFPISDYTPFANVNFAWGTARIYVSKEKVKTYGSNTHILSNGLWQFGKTLKDKPGWEGKNIEREFYVDVSPAQTVKPEDAGYPFDLNRQNFSKAANEDFNKIFNYITALYRQVDFASEVKNFGTVQYINADGTFTKAKELEPKAPPSANAFTLIKPGDDVEVRDGILYVNNRQLPELTSEDLKNTAIRIDELTIPQSEIDPSRVMVHDNLAVKGQAPDADERLEALANSMPSRYSYTRSWSESTFTIRNDDGSVTTFTGYDSDIASDLEELGKLDPLGAAGDTLSSVARAKFGKRYDSYLNTIGSVFLQLRDALLAADKTYDTSPRSGRATLSQTGIGVSLDQEYYGVSTMLPFEAMFINPATTSLKDTPRQIAVSLLGTMQHELAHFRVRSHDAAFASEMQRIMNLLDTYEGIDMEQVKKELTSFLRVNNDIFTFLDKEFSSGNYQAVGNRLKDSGSYQARNAGAAESMEGSGGAGGRGPSLSAIPQPGAAGTRQVGVGAGDANQTEAEVVRTQKEIDKDVDVAIEKFVVSKDAETAAKSVELMQIARNPKKAIPALNLLWKSATNKQREGLVKLPTMEFLINWANTAVPELRNTYDLMQKMSGMTQNILRASGLLTTDIHRAFLEDSSLKDKLDKIAITSTIAQVDPSDPTSKERSVKLDTQYKALGDKGQEIFKRIKRHFENLSDQYSKLLDDQIMESSLSAAEKANLMVKLRKMYETAKKIAPYFPLVRRGDYWFSAGTGESRQFYMFESMVERDAAMRATADKAMYQKPGESAAAYDKRKEENLKEMVEDEHFGVGNDIHSLRRASFGSSELLRGVFDTIDSSNLGDPDAKEALKDSIYQIYLNTMPEQSFRNQFINRKNITGFSTDLLRNVSTTTVKMATQLARIKYAPKIRNSLSAARDSIAGRPENEPFVTEMEARAAKTLGFDTDTVGEQIAGLFNKASFFFYLGGASSALLQPISVFQTGMPVLAGRYGTVNATREMSKMLKFWSQYGYYRKNADGTKTWIAPTIEHAKGLTADERKAVRGMTSYGVAESTFARALYEQKGSPTEKLSGPKVQLAKDAVGALVLGGLMHSAERISREMMYLTSFRLNMKKHGDYDRAVREAVNDTNEALGNYGAYNRPRFMQASLGKVLTQFMMYPLQTTMFLINNFKQMIAPMDGRTRGEAAVKFFGTMGTTFILAGAIGLPLFSTIMGLLGVAWKELEDKDELPANLKGLSFQLWFRTVFLPEQLGDITVGGKKLSAIVERGPVNAFTGLDIGGRTGLDNLWMREGKEHKNVREEIMALALERAGPGVNMLLSFADAGEAFANGDLKKGTEKMLPAGFRNFVAAHKYSVEGVKDVKGAQIMSKDAFTTGELIGQSIGFRPDLLANAQYVNFKVSGLEQRINNERTQLMNNLDREFSRGNSKEIVEVIKDINKFNNKFPSYEISEENMEESLEKRAEQRASSFKGVVLTDKNVPVFIRALSESRRELIEREQKAKK